MAWASVLGTFLGLLGAIQSLSWLAATGGLMLVGSIAALAYARRQHDLMESAAQKVAGRSLDSLNIASLRRRLNRSLMILEARNEAIIDGEDLTIRWKCIGYCRADRETNIEFSIDTDNNIPFDELSCFAYDLRCDPNKTHRIRPMLLGPDGISKKIAIPFLAPLMAGQPFDVLLTCELPGCMKSGVDYYTASLSFDQDRVRHFSVRLSFLRARPDWLRVYEPGPSGAAKLLKDLRPIHADDNLTEYLDAGENLPPNLIRIYVFSRSGVDVRVGSDDRTSTNVGIDSVRLPAGTDQPEFSELVRRREGLAVPFPVGAQRVDLTKHDRIMVTLQILQAPSLSLEASRVGDAYEVSLALINSRTRRCQCKPFTLRT